MTNLDRRHDRPAGRGASYGPNILRAAQSPIGPAHASGPDATAITCRCSRLDTTLGANPTLTYEALLAGLKDHVVASGEVIGLGQADPAAPPPPAASCRPGDAAGQLSD